MQSSLSIDPVRVHHPVRVPVPVKNAIVLFLVLAASTLLSAQTWNTYNTGNGLAGNTVKKIAIDAAGNKWFATDGGVSKFNGTTWTNYTEKDGLASNYVNAVAIDAQGRKWFGTANGASVFDDSTWTTYTTADGLPDNSIYDVCVDYLGNVWFGTSSGAARFDGSTWTTFMTCCSVFVVEQDPSGNIWLGPGDSGLCRFDGSSWTKYSPQNSGLLSFSVYAVAFDAQETKWCGTNRGISVFDDVTWDTINRSNGLPEQDVYAIAVDAQDKKWFATWGGGLAGYKNGVWNYYTIADGLASDYIWDIVIDRDGSLWIATKDGGVSKFNGSQPPVKHGPDWRWAHGAGCDYNDYCNAAVCGAGGDLFIAGAFGGDSVRLGDTTLHNHGAYTSNDVLFARLDPLGNFKWAKSAGGTDYDEANGMAADPAGNIFITGRFRSASIQFDTETLVNGGNPGTGDVFICKFNENGVLTWSRRLGGPGEDLGSCAATDAQGNLYVAGTLDSTLFIGSWDPAGNQRWLQKATGERFNEVAGIMAERLGNIYLSGSYGGNSIKFGSTELANTGQNYMDAFVYKFNSASDVLWARQVAGSGWETGAGMACDPAGNLFFTGSFNSGSIQADTVTLSNANGPYFDYFLLKMNAAGHVVWGQRGGGIGSDAGISVATDTLGYVYMAGEYRSPSLLIGNTSLPNVGEKDIFLARFSPAGSPAWAKRVGGKGDDFVKALVADGDDNIYLNGYYGSNSLKFDSILMTNPVYYDLYNARIGAWITSNSPVCEGMKLTLSATAIPGFTYKWYGPLGFTSTQQNPVVSNSATAGMSGIYYLYVTQGGQTRPSGHTTVTVNPVPPPPVAGSNSPVCTGRQLYLTATALPGASLFWKGPNGYFAAKQNPVVSDSAQVSMSGTYTVSEKIRNCPDNKDYANVIVYGPAEKPVVTWQTPELLSTTAAGYQWFLEGNEIPGETMQRCTPHQNGNFMVETADSNGCRATSEIYDLQSYGQQDDPAFLSPMVFPNPTRGMVSIIVPAGVTGIRVFDPEGRTLQVIPVAQQRLQVYLKDAGVYFVTFEGESRYSEKKVVVLP